MSERDSLRTTGPPPGLVAREPRQDTAWLTREEDLVESALLRACKVRSASLAALDRRAGANSFGAALLEWMAESGGDAAASLPPELDPRQLRSGRLGAKEIGADTLATLCRGARLDRMEFLAFVAQDVEHSFKERVERREFRDRRQLAAAVEKEHTMLQRLQELLRWPVARAPRAASRSQPEVSFGTSEDVGKLLAALYPWARRRVPAGIDAEDLVQETLLAFVAHASRFQGSEGDVLAYLRTTFTNKLRDVLRRQRSRQSLALGPEHMETTVSDSHTTPSVAPQGQLAAHRASYERALARLPERMRQAVQLRLEEGSSYAAIAAAIGSPSTDAARMYVTRGIVRLAKEMQDHDD